MKFRVLSNDGKKDIDVLEAETPNQANNMVRKRIKKGEYPNDAVLRELDKTG